MPLTATFINEFHAVFTPPAFTSQVSAALPLLTELDTIIQTESSQDIFIESAEGNIPTLVARRVGLNSFRVSGVLST